MTLKSTHGLQGKTSFLFGSRVQELSANVTERARDHASRWLRSQNSVPLEPAMAAELQSMKAMLEQLMESKVGSGEELAGGEPEKKRCFF